MDMLNTIAMVQGGCSLFLSFLGIVGAPDGFLTVGNTLCCFANGLWVYLINKWRMNPNTKYAFLMLCLLNAIALYRQLSRWRDPRFATVDSDSDSEPEEEFVPARRGKKKSGGAGMQKIEGQQPKQPPQQSEQENTSQDSVAQDSAVEAAQAAQAPDVLAQQGTRKRR